MRVLSLSIFVFAAFTGLSLEARAFEALTYGQRAPASAQLMLGDWLARETSLTLDDYETAMADLNRDGLGEYILKPRKCYGSDGLCEFLVLAGAGGQAVLLAKISAKKLALGDSYHAGVQDILAFRRNNNDYEYDIFVWDPPSMVYVLNGRTEG